MLKSSLDFDGHVDGANYGGTGFSYLQVDTAHAFNSFQRIKLRISKTNYIVYYNDTPILTYPRDTTKAIVNSLYLDAAFLGNDGAIDHIKVFDNQGNLRFVEDFEKPSEPARPDMNLPCTPLTYCQAFFTSYFNQRMGTSYSFNQISDFYLQILGEALNICN